MGIEKTIVQISPANYFLTNIYIYIYNIYIIGDSPVQQVPSVEIQTEGNKISAKCENYYIDKIFKPFMSTKRSNVHAKLHLYSQVKDDFTYEEYLNITRFRLSAHWLPRSLLKEADTKDPSLIENTDYVLSVKHAWAIKYMHLCSANVTS